MFTRSLFACAFLGASAMSAAAVPVAYSFDGRFQSYTNNAISGVETGQGGRLVGTLVLDSEMSGNGRVVSFDLTSYLPQSNGGGVSRSSSYSSSGSATYAFGGDILQIVTPTSSTRERIVFDFTGVAIGGSSIAPTVSESFFNCKGVFSGGYPANSCNLPNFGIGLGTGLHGSNGATEFSASSAGRNPTVPLPPSLPALGAAVGALGVMARRRRRQG